MSRGDIYSAAARGAYTGKPRPVIVVQDDRFDATASITVCPTTTSSVDAPLLRVRVEPSELNGLDRPSWLMIDKLATIPRGNLQDRLGRLEDQHRVQLNRALIVFFGLADAGQAS